MQTHTFLIYLLSDIRLYIIHVSIHVSHIVNAASWVKFKISGKASTQAKIIVAKLAQT